MAVKPIPDGYHSVTPYLIIGGAARALEFYKQVFGAVEKFRMDGPDGRVGHAEIQIGDSHLMLADEHPERNIRGPLSIGGNSISLLLYVEDVDAQFKKAIEAGAKEKMPVQDQFYGDRSGTLTDPFGHVWTIATHKEDVSHEEMQRRIEAFTKAQGAA